jgi:hypothetical protein
MAKHARGKSRVVLAPAPFLPPSASLPPNCVVSLVLAAGERVEWTWTTDPSGARYVTGYTISRPRRARGVGKKDQRLTWEETYRETAREKEGWSDLDATLADGIDPGEKTWGAGLL